MLELAQIRHKFKHCSDVYTAGQISLQQAALSLLEKRNGVQPHPMPGIHSFRQTSPTLVGPPGILLSLSGFEDVHMRRV